MVEKKAAKKRNTFKDLIASEKFGGIALLACTIVSLTLSNTSIGVMYVDSWNTQMGSLSLLEWINDGLMTIFFFLIGLELIESFKDGDLSEVKTASLPIAGALGGMLIPAFIYLYFNINTATERGIGIPMATDIAFALGVLSLLGKRVPMALKVFLTALAVIDDLGAIIMIALFYSGSLAWLYLGMSLLIFLGLMLCNKVFHIRSLIFYLCAGIVMWYCMLQSQVHPAIAGVLLAIAIPYTKGERGFNNPNRRLQYFLHLPVSLFIVPLFALANTAIPIALGIGDVITEPLGLGIILGLVLGKPLGIGLFSYLAVKLNIGKLPANICWKELFSLGVLGGVGFTMSIFVTSLAFSDKLMVDEAKLMILAGSLLAGFIGFLLLLLVLKRRTSV